MAVREWRRGPMRIRVEVEPDEAVPEMRRLAMLLAAVFAITFVAVLIVLAVA